MVSSEELGDNVSGKIKRQGVHWISEMLHVLVQVLQEVDDKMGLNIWQVS